MSSEDRYLRRKALVPVLDGWFTNHNLIWPSLLPIRILLLTFLNSRVFRCSILDRLGLGSRFSSLGFSLSDRSWKRKKWGEFWLALVFSFSVVSFLSSGVCGSWLVVFAEDLDFKERKWVEKRNLVLFCFDLIWFSTLQSLHCLISQFQGFEVFFLVLGQLSSSSSVRNLIVFLSWRWRSVERKLDCSDSWGKMNLFDGCVYASVFPSFTFQHFLGNQMVQII